MDIQPPYRRMELHALREEHADCVFAIEALEVMLQQFAVNEEMDVNEILPSASTLVLLFAKEGVAEECALQISELKAMIAAPIKDPEAILLGPVDE